MGSGRELDRGVRVYVAGHLGLAGSAVWRALAEAGFTDLVGAGSSEVDLRDRGAALDRLRAVRPDVLVAAAAGGGRAPAAAAGAADLLSDNLRIQLNVLDAAHAAGVPRLLLLGTSGVYPERVAQPIHESSLLTGPPAAAGDAHTLAAVLQVRAHRGHCGERWSCALAAPLYGPGGSFAAAGRDVLSALVRQLHDAAESGAESVLLAGSGTSRREFLHVDDFGRAIVRLLDDDDPPEVVNVGAGADLTVRRLAEAVAEAVGFTGEIVFDSYRPDGPPRRLLDTTRLRALGWSPRIPLADGIDGTYEWFLQHRAESRL